MVSGPQAQVVGPPLGPPIEVHPLLTACNETQGERESREGDGFDRPKTKELSQNTRPITSLNVFQDYLYGSAKRIRRSHMSEREKLGTIWEVSDELWERIEPVILEEDPPKARGRKRADAREMLNGIIFRLRSGCQWNQLPKELGDDSTIHRTLQRWVELGVMRRVWAALIEGCDELGGVQWEWQAADAAMSKARLGGT